MGAVSCLDRFNMLSLYAVLVLALSLNVDGKCQRGESSLCFVADMPNLRLNKCCRGLERTELEGGNGDKFCMEKNATRLAEGESCKGFSRNCQEGPPARPPARGERSARGECVLFLSSSERT